MTDTQTVVEYTVSITVKRPVRPLDIDQSVEAAAQWLTGMSAKRELEREIIRALRKLDGDCDAEVLETRTFEEPA